MFGGALGDAAGLATDFLPKSLVLSYYGPNCNFYLGCKVYPDSHRVSFTVGDWTDDTDQSILG
ncbi:ADP-ribosylglycohydrolase family protein [archaeon]|nr:MAG: ADP-ribosylglycohydrolase family protein [archaeon]